MKSGSVENYLKAKLDEKKWENHFKDIENGILELPFVQTAIGKAMFGTFIVGIGLGIIIGMGI